MNQVCMQVQWYRTTGTNKSKAAGSIFAISCRSCQTGILLRADFLQKRSVRHMRKSRSSNCHVIWYVSNVSIIFYCSMLLYYPFWKFMGFTIHFYIIFGTNLLTGGPAQIAVLLPISVFRRKGISNGVQMEWNLRKRSFWNKHDAGDLEWMSSNKGGGHEGARHAHYRWARPHPRGPLERPPTYFFLLYIPMYAKTIEQHHEKLFPPL